MRYKRISTSTWMIFITMTLSMLSNPLFAAELSIVSERQESTNNYTVRADGVEKLAGLKISLSYPVKLQYKAAQKGNDFKSFLHVVNDKVPGKIIVVMASAKGVTGKNLPLFTLDFRDSGPMKTPPVSPLRITGCELMSEDLKEIPCEIPENS